MVFGFRVALRVMLPVLILILVALRSMYSVFYFYPCFRALFGLVFQSLLLANANTGLVG